MRAISQINISHEQKILYKALDLKLTKWTSSLMTLIEKQLQLKRCRDDEDKDKEPSAGSNWGSKRRRARKEPESTSALKEKTSKTTGKSNEGSKSQHSMLARLLKRRSQCTLPMTLKNPHIRSSKQESLTINLKKKPIHFLISFRNLQDLLLPIVIGTRLCQLIMDQYNLDVESSLSQSFRLSNGMATNIWIGSPFEEMMTSFTHSRKATSKAFSFKARSKPSQLLLVQDKLTNLNVEERPSLSVVFLLTECSQEVLSLFLAYTIPEDCILSDRNKKNKLMRVDKLHMFSDGTLNDVRTALDDRLKGIRMEYLPKTVWRQSDRE
ncbi:hypothetical protein Tco_0646498 [Tanacetum coccineum]